MADKIYFLPVNPEFVADVIEKERPDAILLGFGGQTALNCGVGLSRKGILEKYGVKVLGTQIQGDRDHGGQGALQGDDARRSGVACPEEQARLLPRGGAGGVAKEIGYPVIMRVAYTLGGRGGGVARNERELDEIVQRGLNLSMAHQVLIEEYIGHWKQIEYEVMRDADDNGQIVCNMENVLSMRVHTGDNIVVAPSQTINQPRVPHAQVPGPQGREEVRDSGRVQHAVRARAAAPRRTTRSRSTPGSRGRPRWPRRRPGTPSRTSRRRSAWGTPSPS